MNDNLGYIVARRNVERIYGIADLPGLDDDFIEAVVTVAKGPPGREPRSDKAETPRGEKITGGHGKIINLAKRLKGGRP